MSERSPSGIGGQEATYLDAASSRFYLGMSVEPGEYRSF
jgi:hypothetical protein